ncbi:hypothetical protein SAMN04487958_107171 [Vreelandella subterranea]|uniref:Uncharacterized protein n=1 Tax=Vreelandella subterranea TaxID=416874 RepID=A0A1H9UR35_9GAMM|nr:hypothetical protein [Halomonas subterranea]SES11955.1 hypothetical protein SAMN04487958_107171 [Halomonas subterranea]
MLSPVVNRSYQVVYIAPKARAQIAIHQAFKLCHRLKSRVNIRVSVSVYGRLDSLDPAKHFCLHYQHGFKHFLCVVFSHVVFLQLVGGVAASTLAGDGVAFYLWGAP